MKKAMILAAGQGTRLKPFTETMPKALFPVEGVPLLEILITKLKKFGYNDIIINTYHFSDKIIDFIQSKKSFDINIEISEEKELLETGGGLKNVSSYFINDEPFLVHNVDILSDIDFNELHNYHLNHNSIASLAVSKRQSSRYLLFDKQQMLKGWENIKTGEKIVHSHEILMPFAFSGIQLISPEIFHLMPEKSFFSLTEFYLSICNKYNITSFFHHAEKWADVGKAEQWIKD